MGNSGDQGEHPEIKWVGVETQVERRNTGMKDRGCRRRSPAGPSPSSRPKSPQVSGGPHVGAPGEGGDCLLLRMRGA